MKKLALLSFAAVMAAAVPALAQGEATPASTGSTTTSQPVHTHTESYSAPSRSQRSSSGIALELQGRLPVLNVLNTNTFLGGMGMLSGSDGRPNVLVPPLTLGLRLLDTRLFVGLGVGWYSQKLKNCPTGGGTCGTDRIRGFSLSPTVTYDVLSRGPARLYPIGMVNLGRLGSEKQSFGGTSMTTDGNFFVGVNVGLGIRAEFADVFTVGTEWGWGFSHVKNPNPPAGEKQTLFGQGAWGTIFLAARIGL